MASQIKLFIISSLSILTCFLIQIKLSVSPVLTAAGVALLASILFKNAEYRAIIYIGTFCAMGASFQNSNIYIYAPIMALINLILFKIFEFHFIGHGGKLGSIAFISTLIVFLMEQYVLF